MKIDRKDLICQVATDLFNEKGYDKVSMREIAKAANTTIGNLTYHFQKKEDIVIRIVSDLQNDYSIYFSTELYKLDLLKDLIKSFKKANDSKEKYPFYYKNLNDIVKSSDYFLNMNYSFQKKLYDYYLSSFVVLQQDEVLKNEFTLDDFHSLAYSFTMQNSGWIIECLPYNNPNLRRIGIAENLVASLKPYINTIYLEDYKRIVDEILK